MAFPACATCPNDSMPGCDDRSWTKGFFHFIERNVRESVLSDSGSKSLDALSKNCAKLRAIDLERFVLE